MANKQELFAVIDVGSHQLTLKIAEIPARGRPRIVEEARGALALGEDTYTLQRIREESTRACCRILEDFRHKLAEYKLTEAIVVATSAIREARNRDYVLTRIRQSTGFHVRILDNNVERYYHQIAMSEGIPDFASLQKKGAVVIDIGAGSMQISRYQEDGLSYSYNLLLGALRVSEMMNSLKDKARDYTQLLDEYINSELKDFRILEARADDAGALIALGSQMTYLKKLAGMKQSEEIMPSTVFLDVLNRLRTLRPVELTTKYGVPSNEAELLLPAASVLEKYTSHVRDSVIHMPKADLSNGLLLDLASQKKKMPMSYDHSQDITSMARHLASRFRYDRDHTDNVTDHALELFDVLRKPYGLTPRMRIYLEVAGILHDVGKFVQINRHSRQSFTIINNLDLFGLSDRERLMTAYIARFHSAVWYPSLENMPDLSVEDRQIVLQLAALLRLADGLDASHAQKIGILRPRIKGEKLLLNVGTGKDTTLEAATVAEKGLLLMEIYGLTPEFRYIDENPADGKEEAKK